jgi:hypothetical protein
MPKLSANEIKEWIAEGRVFAISIDTAIFDGKQKTFQNAALRSLSQFQEREVSVVFVDIIAEEMKSHLRDGAAETQRALKKALRAHSIRWRRKPLEGEDASLLIAAVAADFAQAEFNEFFEFVNGIMISVGDTPDAVQKIFRRYFAEEAPFGSADKRKSEFPDAFALDRLEAFAAEKGKALICVSPDNGWIEYASQSAHLISVTQLEDALALFNAADQHLADAIVDSWRRAEGGEFVDAVYSAVEYRLDEFDFEIDGRSDLYFEAEPLSAFLREIPQLRIGSPTIIAVDGATVTFTIRVEAVVEFEALFSFYLYDSFDKDSVRLGAEEASSLEAIPFDLTIKADRSLIDGPVFHEVEVARKRFEVDFGYVEVFLNEDPNHEKY